jgi:hypothetical protein
MGTGDEATSTAAGRIGTIALLGKDAQGQDLQVNFTTELKSPDHAPNTGVYQIDKRSDRTFRYGGPGYVGPLRKC